MEWIIGIIAAGLYTAWALRDRPAPPPQLPPGAVIDPSITSGYVQTIIVSPSSPDQVPAKIGDTVNLLNFGLPRSVDPNGFTVSGNPNNVQKLSDYQYKFVRPGVLSVSYRIAAVTRIIEIATS